MKFIPKMLGGTEAATTDPGLTGNQLIGRLLSILCTFSFYAGIVVIGIAVFQFIMSFKEQEPERQHRAIILAIVGVAMISLGSILGFIFRGTGFEGAISYSIF